MFSPFIDVVKASTRDYTHDSDEQKEKEKNKNNIELGCIIVQDTYIFLGHIIILCQLYVRR